MTTIQKCWQKSIVIKKLVDQEIEDNQHQERDELQAQIAALLILDPLSVDKFIQPASEVVKDDQNEDIFVSVVEWYSTIKEGAIKEVEEGDIEVPKVSTNEAILALETVRLQALQQDEEEVSNLQALDRLRRHILQKKHELRKQVTIESFFQPI